MEKENLTESTLFNQVSSRLEYLEKWREIAIRPTFEQCHQDDYDMLNQTLDDLNELTKRCLAVRHELNLSLPPHKIALDADLVVRKSQIPNAGNGLYYEPTHGKSRLIIHRDSIICYYTGYRHNFLSQKYLKNKSYLLNISGDILVDPYPTPNIKGRYINDPRNEEVVNCQFVPDVKTFSCKVVALRDIQAGEELFVSYGEMYWSNQGSCGTVFKVKDETCK